ncbi:MAG: hypothetical protein ACK56I_19810, partial [bacterium]
MPTRGHGVEGRDVAARAGRYGLVSPPTLEVFFAGARQVPGDGPVGVRGERRRRERRRRRAAPAVPWRPKEGEIGGSPARTLERRANQDIRSLDLPLPLGRGQIGERAPRAWRRVARPSDAVVVRVIGHELPALGYGA